MFWFEITAALKETLPQAVICQADLHGTERDRRQVHEHATREPTSILKKLAHRRV
jgi:hypothetical protein